jgi:hypothetical protein
MTTGESHFAQINSGSYGGSTKLHLRLLCSQPMLEERSQQSSKQLFQSVILLIAYATGLWEWK